MSLDLDPSQIFRDFTTDGIPASGKHDPKKVEIRQHLSALRQAVIALVSDADPGLALPNLLIRAADTGAGAPNAIQATTNLPVPGADATALIALNIIEANTGAPVTVSFNGGPVLTIKTSSGNDVAAGGLVEGMMVLGVVSESTFRLFSDQASGSIVAAAEVAAQRAEDAEESILGLLGSVTPSFPSIALASSFSPDIAPSFIQTVGGGNAGDGGGGIYAAAASEPSHAGKFSITLSGGGSQWYELSQQVIHPEAFGAFADGSNYAAQLQALINFAAATGAVIDGRGRTYKTDVELILPVHRAKWRSITLDGRDIPRNGIFTTTVASMTCDLPVLIGTLTANRTASGLSAVVDTNAGLEIDDWFLLRSQYIMSETEVEGQSTRHGRACELHQVRILSSPTSVGFWAPCKVGYLTADNARIEKIQTVGGVDFDNVWFIGNDRGFYISEGFRSKYRNCGGIGQTTVGVYEDRCYLTDGDGWYFEGDAAVADFTIAMYGLQYTGCMDCNYGDVRGFRTRHLTTTGSAGGPKGRSVSRGCTLGNIHALECFSSPVDQHPGGGFLQVGNVHAEFAFGTGFAGACQFQGQGGHVASIRTLGENTACDVLFDSYGWLDSNTSPHVTVGSIESDLVSNSINAVNNTNRFGTSQAQKIMVEIAAIRTRCEVGISGLARSGNVEISVGPGEILATSGGGTRRGILASSTAMGKLFIRTFGTRIRAAGGARAVELLGDPYRNATGNGHGAELEMFGGSIETTGGGNTILYADDSYAYLTSVRLTAVTETVENSNAVISKTGFTSFPI